jgi:hypothetical protein
LRVSHALHRIDRYLVSPTGVASAWIATLGVAGSISFVQLFASWCGLAARLSGASTCRNQDAGSEPKHGHTQRPREQREAIA